MTLLKDAIFEMKPGDKFKWLGDDYVYMDNDKVLREKSGSLLRTSPGNLNVNGEIIPAEPVVLSAEDIFKKIHRRSGPGHWDNIDIKNAIKIANQNGRLEEWLKPEQVALREVIKSLVNWMDEHAIQTFCNVQLKQILKVFENLKPPGQDD